MPDFWVWGLLKYNSTVTWNRTSSLIWPWTWRCEFPELWLSSFLVLQSEWEEGITPQDSWLLNGAAKSWSGHQLYRPGHHQAFRPWVPIAFPSCNIGGGEDGGDLTGRPLISLKYFNSVSRLLNRIENNNNNHSSYGESQQEKKRETAPHATIHRE